MYHPELEIALVRWMASTGGQYWVLDSTSVVLVSNNLFRGLPAVAILVGYWSAQVAPERLLAFRRVVLAGFIAAGVAFVVSRLVQNAWTTPRPIHHPALSGLYPFNAALGREYNSFPSDHAAFLTPLVWAVGLLQPWLGVLTALLLALALTARVHQGLHFPVDLAVGFAIGAVAIMTLGRPDSRVTSTAMTTIADAQARWPRLTACALFLLAYGYASMFTDFRAALSAMGRALGRL